MLSLRRTAFRTFRDFSDMRHPARLAVGLLLSASVAVGAPDNDPPPPPTLKGLRIASVTAFKDGTAYVQHRGTVRLNEQGEALLEELPPAMLGTFWVKSATDGIAVTSAKSAERDTTVSRKAETILDVLRANVGGTIEYRRTSVSPTGNTTSTATSGKIVEGAPANADFVYLQVGKAIQVFRPTPDMEITFASTPRTRAEIPSKGSLLSVGFKSTDKKTPKQVDLDVTYVQGGLRWIPSYRVRMGEDGKSGTVEMQATLVNDLGDLDNAAVDLVVGVPSFKFAGEIDPIALQRTAAQIDVAPAQYRRNSQMLSNSIMAQSAYSFDGADTGSTGGATNTPQVDASEKSEDLYVFHLSGITLKRGERMIVPVTEFPVQYEIKFKATIPFGAPAEIRNTRRDFNSQPPTEDERMAATPMAKSFLCINNTSEMPFTTAPALIMKGDSVMAQSLMRYTPVGGGVDLELTTAVDIQLKKRDRETARTPNDVKYNGTSFSRVDNHGTISVTNRRQTPVSLELKRELRGRIDKADNNGDIAQLSGDWDQDFTSGDTPDWWNWYSWPWWYQRINLPATVTWKLELKPGESKELGYDWAYWWE